MKTEVKHEHGDWVVLVDDNPKFGFIYKEEAENVRELIDMLVMTKLQLENCNTVLSEDFNERERSQITYTITASEKTLKKLTN